ncbi:oligosaccharide flippase family protein [bacterium]|nr:oligosaccharide flippase family protein [bacterium]
MNARVKNQEVASQETVPETPAGANVARLKRFLASYWTPAGKTAARNLTWLLACQGVSMACNFGILLILVNSMSPTDFGIYSSGFSVAAMLSAVGSSGTKNLALRHLVRRPHKSGLLMGSYLVVTAAAVSIAAAMLWLYSAINGAGAVELMYLFLVCVSGLATSLTITHAFDARHSQATPAIVAGLSDLCVLFAFWTISHQHEVTLIIAGSVFATKSLLQAILIWSLYCRINGAVRTRFRIRHICAMFRSSLVLAIAFLFASIPMTGQGYIARQFLGPTQAATLGAVLPFLFLYVTLSSLSLRLLSPYVHNSSGNDPTFLRKTYVFQIAFGVVLFLSIAGFSWITMTCFMPDRYSAAWPLAVALSVFAAPYQIGILNTILMVRSANYKAVMSVHAVSACLFLSCIFLFSAHMGLWAFPLAVGASSLTVGWLSYSFCRQGIASRVSTTPGAI